MKNIVTLIIVLFCFGASAQPIQKNYFTTNPNPTTLTGGLVSNAFNITFAADTLYTNTSGNYLQAVATAAIPGSDGNVRQMSFYVDTNADGGWDITRRHYAATTGGTTAYVDDMGAGAFMPPGSVFMWTNTIGTLGVLDAASGIVSYFTTGGSVGPADGATIQGLEVGSYKGPTSWMFTNAVWVDVTNGLDDVSVGTYESPFASIGFAATNSPGGGVVLVKPGLYVESIQRFWGQKDYVLSKGVTLVGKTNSGPSSIYSVYQGFTQNSVQTTNDFPVRIFGRGRLIGGNDALPTVLIDNGSVEIESEFIWNPNAAGYAVEFQGDDDDANDATISVKIRNSVVASRINILPFEYTRNSLSELTLENVTLTTTNLEPFLFDDFTAGEGRAFKLILNGVDSRCAQTNLLDVNAGSRIFGSMLILTNLPGGESPGYFKQEFDPVLFSGELRGDGDSLTNLTFKNLTAPAGTPAVTTNVSFFNFNSLLTGLPNAGFTAYSGGGAVAVLRSGSTDNRGIVDIYNGGTASAGNTNMFVLTLSSNYPAAGYYYFQVASSNITSTANLVRIGDVTTSNVLFQTVLAHAAGSRYVITYLRIP